MMFYFIFAILIVLADQALKYFITLKLALGGQIPLIPGVIHLTYVRNTGAAFSILTEYTWLLTIISALASVLLIILIIKMKIGTPGRICLAAVLGGAIGNLIDRALLGYVVDMFEVEFTDYAVFNIADMFISVGGTLFCLYYIYYTIKEDRDKPKKAASHTTLVGPEDKLTDTLILTEYEISRLCADESVRPEMPDSDYLSFAEDEIDTIED